MRYLSYQILGRGDIIITNTVEIPNRKSHTITFLASFAMVPSAQFIVYFIRNNEIVSDKIEIHFSDDLQNFVSKERNKFKTELVGDMLWFYPLQVELDVSTNKATPGQEVDITIISKPNSYIGLLAIDQNAMFLRDGNNLDKHRVFNELKNYEKYHFKPDRNYGTSENWEDFVVSSIISLK